MGTTASAGATGFQFKLFPGWPVAAGLTAMAAPTLFTLGDQFWSKEIGAHGPIILATGLWLLGRQRSELQRYAEAPRGWLTALLLIPSLLSYIFGRTFGFVALEAGGLYGAGVAALHNAYGLRALRRNWFPLLYLAASVPPPTWVIDDLTAPLKHFVTYVSTTGLQALGYPVAREGVTIFVAQYQLLVEDACSGMHSIVGLVAITALYVYLMRGQSWRYLLLFVALAVPIAVLANIVRIVTLVLLTYYGGNELAQGFLHFTAGILLFTVALLLVFACDQAFQTLRARPRTTAQKAAA